MADDGAVTLLAVGDVFLDRPEPAGAFEAVREVFAAGDVVVGNCEGAYAESWERAPSAAAPLVGTLEALDVVAGGGFDVMALANNHYVDGGHPAARGTREALRAAGVATAGAGENLDDARRPAVLEAGGRTVAVLSYASVFPHGYEARPGAPGLAPLRAHNLYTPWEANDWNPGIQPRVTTVPHKPDHAAFEEDIRKAKESADIVVVNVHWGDFTRPFVLTDHERRAARLAIDAGADAVLGHHHHLLRAVETYRGKPIFYGLSHFAFDAVNVEQRIMEEGILLEAVDPDWIRNILRRFGEYRMTTREDSPLLPFHPDSRMTGIAAIRFGADGDVELGFVPCILGADNVPTPVDSDSEDGARVGEYLTRCCAEEMIQTTLEPGGMTVGPVSAFAVRAAEEGQEAAAAAAAAAGG